MVVMAANNARLLGDWGWWEKKSCGSICCENGTLESVISDKQQTKFIGTVVFWCFGSSQQSSDPCEITRWVSKLMGHWVLLLFQGINGFFRLFQLQRTVFLKHFYPIDEQKFAQKTKASFQEMWIIIKVPLTPKFFISRQKSRFCSDHIGEKIIVVRFFLDFLWFFKLRKIRTTVVHHRVTRRMGRVGLWRQPGKPYDERVKTPDQRS